MPLATSPVFRVIKCPLIVQALLLASTLKPVTSQAQNKQPSDANRSPYFVGLQTANNRYEVLYRRSSPGEALITTPLITAGFYILPRLAVQLGYGYLHDISEDPGASGITLSGQRITLNRHGQESRQQAFPLLARYSLSNRSRSRLRADALAGLTMVTSRFTFHNEHLLDGQVTFQESINDHATQFYCTVGMGLRFVISHHFEASGDLTWSKNLETAPEYVHREVTGNGWGITRAVNLGLRYRFAVKKKAVAAAGF